MGAAAEEEENPTNLITDKTAAAVRLLTAAGMESSGSFAASSKSS